MRRASIGPAPVNAVTRTHLPAALLFAALTALAALTAASSGAGLARPSSARIGGSARSVSTPTGHSRCPDAPDAQYPLKAPGGLDLSGGVRREGDAGGGSFGRGSLALLGKLTRAAGVAEGSLFG